MAALAMDEIVDMLLIDPPFEKELIEEIGGAHRILLRIGDAISVSPLEKPIYWHRNWWRQCQVLPAESITLGASRLKTIARLWDLYSISNHRRAALIQENLKGKLNRPLSFPFDLTFKRRGVWTLRDQTSIVASTKPITPLADGRFEFAEDRKNPPNRAYVKLWELFTRIGAMPKAGDRCVDLGSSPGGWTWALQSVGAQVISVDKAPLESRVQKLERVEFIQESAFGLQPNSIGQVDWLFSDVICYPERLFQLIENWLNSGLAKKIICTIKFRAKTDFSVIRRFEALGGSLIHLYHNKHELTWYRL